MAKFLLEATYTAEGIRGLMKDTASVREARIKEMVATAGGKVDSIHFALGETDVYVIFDMPDVTTVASLSLAVGASGVVNIKTTALLTPAEIDTAIRKGVIYRPPGS